MIRQCAPFETCGNRVSSYSLSLNSKLHFYLHLDLHLHLKIMKDKLDDGIGKWKWKLALAGLTLLIFHKLQSITINTRVSVCLSIWLSVCLAEKDSKASSVHYAYA